MNSANLFRMKSLQFLLLTLVSPLFGCGSKSGEIVDRQQIFDSYDEAKIAIEQISDEYFARTSHAV